jgi:hypothetical protein
MPNAVDRGRRLIDTDVITVAATDQQQRRGHGRQHHGAPEH